MCNSERSTPIKFVFYNKGHNYRRVIGECVGSIDHFEKNKINLLQKPGSSSTNLGRMEIMDLRIVPLPNFVEYFKVGWKVNLSVAIDFTESNKDFKFPDSLHYLDGKNQYEQAIKSVGDIL